MACMPDVSIVSHFKDLPDPRIERAKLDFVQLDRRWDRRISKRGHYRDPLASSRKRTVSTSTSST